MPRPALSTDNHDHFRRWLDLIDELRSIGIGEDISLPQIAVMGDQSSGKSSVLEALSKIEFPRGCGIVTRCATELRMKRIPDSEWKGHIKVMPDGSQPSESGELTSPEEIGNKIVKLTKALTNGENDIQPDKSILLEVSSSNCLDLTIIDLPGIVRRKMDGQSDTVIKDVDSLLQRYLEQERTVILAVIPSNVDIATVDIIERASKVDPDFARTIGVFTKPDMMGPGELKEKIGILKGENQSVQLTCTMVRNRDLAQIEGGMSLEDAKVMERDWFRQHPQFGSMDPSLFGIQNLGENLGQILGDRIKKAVPDLHKEVLMQLNDTNTELSDLGAAPPTSQDEMRSVLMNLLHSVTRDIRNAIDGTYQSKILNESPNLRIYAIFHALAVDFGEKIIKAQPKWEIDELKKLTAEMRGRELPGFLTSTVFNHFVTKFVESWRDPLYSLVDEIHTKVVTACMEIINHHVSGFRNIATTMKTKIHDIMSNAKENAKNAKSGGLEDLFSNELMPSTMNPHFMELYNQQRIESFREFMRQALDKADNGDGLHRSNFEPLVVNLFEETNKIGSDSNQTQEAENLKRMLEAYWKTSTARFIDFATRSVDRLLMQSLDENIEKQFTAVVHNSSDLGDFFHEDREAF